MAGRCAAGNIRWYDVDRLVIREPNHMQLARFITARDKSPRAGAVARDRVFVLGEPPLPLCDVLHASNPELRLRELLESATTTLSLSEVTLLPPVDRQEVWGAGVTYLRSKEAREDESERAATFYDQVYSADRPELFFKATPSRVVGHGQAIRVRSDTRWCVPEPELALVLAPDLRLVGFTIGNDVSARDIEGRN
ncbi:MAG TPA: fumarylacetoacetate hydrolase family protein, partial [Isosphaeraceae bacterium]|nr:fumarylacetoacetate hydrolase family protein [Isosphaeraceae bacterium]